METSNVHSASDSDSDWCEDSMHSANDGVFQAYLHKRVRPYIEMIDSLRVIGIDRDLDLPSIAVVGDQSSGKSSVLEALSGVALPRGSGIVTRCPLELKLRRLSRGKWTAVISYAGFKEEFYDPFLVEKLVREAQNKLAGDGVDVCDDLISLEITSPDVCDLTLIDLPGITRVPVKGQPEDIGDQIRRLILKYIAKSETINLVVVPCNVDIATTEALRMAQEVDPAGNRTLAILTKPDLIDKGAEIDVLNIIHGKVIPLSKGYIMVRCRGQSDINEKISLVEATKIELEFFKNHRYFSSLLDDQKATTQCLARKLTQDLVDHIRKTLPRLTEQIQKRLYEVKAELRSFAYGPPLEQKMRGAFLSQIVMEFSDQINKMCETGESKDNNLYSNLRPVFRQWEVFLQATKASFEKKVQDMIKRYDELHRGRELLTFSDYCAFEFEIKKHVVDLEEPAIDTLLLVREIVQKEFKIICDSSFTNYPQLRCIISNKIADIQGKQQAKVEKRIKEFIQMEQLIYSQDPIYKDRLDSSKISQKVQNGSEKDDLFYYPDDFADQCAALDTRKLTPDKLVAYYEIVYQRLADYVPMLIMLFMLKKSAKILRQQMMELRSGADVVRLLSEDSERGRRRLDLMKRLDRLQQAQEMINVQL